MKIEAIKFARLSIAVDGVVRHIAIGSMTMVHLRLVAGTDVSGVPGTEMSIEPAEASTSRTEEKACEALRNLKLPGQEKTVGELRDEVSRRCRKGGPSNSTQRALFERFWALVSSVGISLSYGPTGRNGDIEFRCVVSLRDELVAAHPELKPYVFVLEGLEF